MDRRRVPAQDEDQRREEAKAKDQGSGTNGCHVAQDANETGRQNPGAGERALGVVKPHAPTVRLIRGERCSEVHS